MKRPRSKAKRLLALARRETALAELPAGERFFTKREMARLLKVSVRTVTLMMHRGELAYLKIGGRLVRFRLADVERSLKETVWICHGEAGASNQ